MLYEKKNKSSCCTYTCHFFSPWLLVTMQTFFNQCVLSVVKHQSRNYWSGGVIFLFVTVIIYIFFLIIFFFFFFFHSINFLNCLFECILSYVFTVSCNLYKKNHSQKEKKKKELQLSICCCLKFVLYPFYRPFIEWNSRRKITKKVIS